MEACLGHLLMVKRADCTANIPWHTHVSISSAPNGIIERIHQVVGDMICTQDIRSEHDLDPAFGFQGVLAAVRDAVRCIVHTATQATPAQLAFGRDALLNISFKADWQCIKKRKQHRIMQNNKAKNATQREHTYNPGDQAVVKADPSRKLEGECWIGPHTVTQAFEDNGTLQLTRNAPTRGGAVSERWNIRQVKPC